MTTEQTRALNALNYVAGLAQSGIHYAEAQDSLETAFNEIYSFIYPSGNDEEPDPEPKEAPCECDL
jgi:hypothetical protein